MQLPNKFFKSNHYHKNLDKKVEQTLSFLACIGYTFHGKCVKTFPKRTQHSKGSSPKLLSDIKLI